MRRVVSTSIYLLSAAIGVLAFAYPFLLRSGSAAQERIAPLATAALVGLSLVALLVELQGQALSAKTVAMLGVLVAITSVLRFLEVAFPLPGGFSPIFAPIILVGYVFGAQFGFLMGAFTLLVSALITGGVGPWLPYQMFTAGWVGMTAGWLAHIQLPTSNVQSWKLEVGGWSIGMLAAFGFAWGLLYGAIINLYFWPIAVGTGGQGWAAGLGLRETLARYAAFYVTTSLAWDLAGAVGNAALILLLGAPTVRALARFQRRFHFQML